MKGPLPACMGRGRGRQGSTPPLRQPRQAPSSYRCPVLRPASAGLTRPPPPVRARAGGRARAAAAPRRRHQGDFPGGRPAHGCLTRARQKKGIGRADGWRGRTRRDPGRRRVPHPSIHDPPPSRPAAAAMNVYLGVLQRPSSRPAVNACSGGRPPSRVVHQVQQAVAVVGARARLVVHLHVAHHRAQVLVVLAARVECRRGHL